MKEEKKFISIDIFLGVFCAVFAVIFLVQALQFPGQVGFFPSLVLAFMLFFSLITLGMGVYKTVQTRKGNADYANPEMKRFPFIVLATIVIYVFCMQKIGFFVSTAVFLPCEMLLFGQRKVLPIVISTAIVLVFLYFVFVMQLNIYMPEGLLF